MDKRYDREVHLEVGGETRRVLVCLWGLVLAEEKGLDLQELDTEEAEDSFSTMLDFLWVGMLPFDEELSRKEVGMMFTPADMQKAEEAFNKIRSRQITGEIKEAIDEAGGDEGNPKAQAT